LIINEDCIECNQLHQDLSIYPARTLTERRASEK